MSAIITLSHPLSAHGKICESVASEFKYLEDSRIESRYFEKYLIGKQNSVYFIYAEKIFKTDYPLLVKVLEDVNSYPEFIPGFDKIRVKRLADSRLLASIHFIAPLPHLLSFIRLESVFTTEIETQNQESTYKQCWRQLAENDDRVLEAYKNAPIINKGYWLLEKIDDHGVKLSYHSIVVPPVPLPLFLYKYVVKDSYVDTYRNIMQRAVNENI